MRLKISSPDKVIYEWFIDKITLPTESGDITVLPDQTPIVSALKPGIVKFTLEWWKSEHISISKWMMFTDGKKIRIVTSSATSSPSETEEILIKENVLDKEHFGISCMVAFGYRVSNPDKKRNRRELKDIIQIV